METLQKVQRTITEKDDYLEVWLEQFLFDRKAQSLSSFTVRFYSVKLKVFIRYCETQLIKNISQITATDIRDYLLWLEKAGHNQGGIHAHYRTLKTFLRWYWSETEPNSPNPILKVKAPRVELTPIEGISIEIFHKLLEACKNKRDYCLMCFLMDSGARASEILNVKVADINLINGSVLIRQSKSKKPRVIFLGKQSRLAVRRYLQEGQKSEYLFYTRQGEKMGYWGLRGIIRRLSIQAGIIDPPSPHDFRRGFALEMLRNNCDVFSLQSLMGHSDLQTLRRYLKQTSEDLRLAHKKSSPVDKGGNSY